MQDNERFHRLLHTAEQDEVYIVWKKSYYESAEKFGHFIKWCPKKCSVFYMDMLKAGG